MMNLLAFDTSSSNLYVGASTKDGGFIETCINLGLRHSELLMDTIEGTLKLIDLKTSDLEGIICGKGPGSFTGLRIGMAAAKGLAEALEVPLLSLSSLEAFAQGYRALPFLCAPLIDAKRSRFYSALYFGGKQLAEIKDLSFSDLLLFADQTEAQAKTSGLLPENASPYPLWICGPDVEIAKANYNTTGTRKVYFAESGNLGCVRELLRLGAEGLKRGERDSPADGPDYVRNAEIDLGIVRKPSKV